MLDRLLVRHHVDQEGLARGGIVKGEGIFIRWCDDNPPEVLFDGEPLPQSRQAVTPKLVVQVAMDRIGFLLDKSAIGDRQGDFTIQNAYDALEQAMLSINAMYPDSDEPEKQPP